MSAIILDGELKSALACVRSLGKHGVTVAVGAERASAMSLHSRYAGAPFVYPSPSLDRESFILRVREEAERLGDRPLVYSLSDATTRVLFEHQEELRPYMTLVFPSSESMELAFDKAATYSLARISGVPTIPTHMPGSVEEIEKIEPTLSYPVVVKPRRSIVWYQGKGALSTARFAMGKEALRTISRELLSLQGELPLIQDVVYGKEYGVEMLAREGVPYALVTHERLRSLSPSGGASVLKQTLRGGELTRILEDHARTLVSKLRWSGPIMVEFKVDRTTKKPYLMEINGRFWGSLPLSIEAGVDIPYLFYMAHMEGTIPREPVRGKEGVITTHLLGEVRHLTSVLFKRDPMRPLLYPRRTSAIRDFLFPLPFVKGDVWSYNDPKPAMMECIDAFKRILWK